MTDRNPDQLFEIAACIIGDSTLTLLANGKGFWKLLLTSGDVKGFITAGTNLPLVHGTRALFREMRGLLETEYEGETE